MFIWNQSGAVVINFFSSISKSSGVERFCIEVFGMHFFNHYYYCLNLKFFVRARCRPSHRSHTAWLSGCWITASLGMLSLSRICTKSKHYPSLISSVLWCGSSPFPSAGNPWLNCHGHFGAEERRWGVWGSYAGHFLNANPSHGHEEESEKGGSAAISGWREGSGFLLWLDWSASPTKPSVSDGTKSPHKSSFLSHVVADILLVFVFQHPKGDFENILIFCPGHAFCVPQVDTGTQLCMDLFISWSLIPQLRIPLTAGGQVATNAILKVF